MAALNWVGALLLTPPAPYGIVSFELAGSVEKTQAIIASWGLDAQLHAAFSLGLDYTFMLAYALTLSLACVWAGEVLARSAWPLAGLALPLAWGQWLAAVLDAVENLALWRSLSGPVQAPWPQIAYWCAGLKFMLILFGMIYAFYALAGSFARR